MTQGIDSMIADAWPRADLSKALLALARQTNIRLGEVEGITTSIDSDVRSTAALHGLECKPIAANYQNLEQQLKSASPGLIQVSLHGVARLLVVLRVSSSYLVVLTPALKTVRYSCCDVTALLAADLENPLEKSIDDTLAKAAVDNKQNSTVKTLLLREKIGKAPISGIWHVRPGVDAPFLEQARFHGLHRKVFALLATHVGYYQLWVISWSMIGFGALQGQLAMAWLIAWVLCLVTMVPLRMMFLWQQGELVIRAGALIKRCLLAGAMSQDESVIKKTGVGELFGRVMESHAFETLALNGGLAALVAILELMVAAVVMVNGAAGVQLLLLLIISCCGVAFIFLSLHKRNQAWIKSRIDLTNTFVENMAGHRTRLAQQSSKYWHEQEDVLLQRYVEQSENVAGLRVWFEILPRFWLLFALMVLGGAIVFANPSVTHLAIGLGAVLLCYRALSNLCFGIEELSRAAIAWSNISPFFRALKESRQQRKSHTVPVVAPADHLIRVRGMVFQYKNRIEPTVRDCHLDIAPNAKMILEGASGSGKSSFASVLCGAQEADAGVMLMNGLDKQTIGSQHWRKHALLVPQFHENHIFMGHFAYNLLLGHSWPPTQDDIEAAYEVCEALGLMPLVERMPGGMMQMVGNMGWQLSHGEKSRVYIARALLQKAELIVLDESFAALDPENTQRAMEYIFEKSDALMVIAHP